MTDVFRTPDERFADLPGFAYEPHYAEVDGLRLHHLDEGSGPTVLCFHGEPSWSYLYRHMLDVLVAAGNRVVCPDMAGFGRSDKPTDEDWYTYDRHVDTIAAHIDQLGLEDVTVVVQDWGGPIGLRWAVEHSDQVERLVILNTGLFAGRVSKGFMAWRDFVERTPDLPIGMIIQGGTATDLPPEVVAAYDAPYPTTESKAGAHKFPFLVPTSDDDVGAAEMRAVREALGELGQAGAGRVLRQRPGVPVPAGGRAVHRAHAHRGRPGPHRGRRPLPAGGRGRAHRREPWSGRCSAERRLLATALDVRGRWAAPLRLRARPGAGHPAARAARGRRRPRRLRQRHGHPARAGRALRAAPRHAGRRAALASGARAGSSAWTPTRSRSWPPRRVCPAATTGPAASPPTPPATCTWSSAGGRTGSAPRSRCWPRTGSRSSGPTTRSSSCAAASS